MAFSFFHRNQLLNRNIRPVKLAKQAGISLLGAAFAGGFRRLITRRFDFSRRGISFRFSGFSRLKKDRAGPLGPELPQPDSAWSVGPG
jgi:hypothetical protein